MIGSIKTNLGHSEAGSGLSGILKCVLALETGLIPPSVGLRQINPQLRLKDNNVEVLTQLRTWPQADIPRASINSFGYGGSNAHFIVEAAGPHIPYINGHITGEQSEKSPRSVVLPFSANDEESLKSRVELYEKVLIYGGENFQELCQILSCHRSLFRARGYVVGTFGIDGLQYESRNLLVTHKGTKSITKALPIAFVFSGQGSQWPGMGLELTKQDKKFREALEMLDSYLKSFANPSDWTILETIIEGKASSKVHAPLRSQTICTAIQVALVDLLLRWGVKPAAVVGHSSGEIAAAYAAGHITAYESIALA